MRSSESLTWKIGGEAGTGIKNSAVILAKAMAKGGYYVHANIEYPSIVRGGNNALEVHMSPKPIHSLTGEVNILAALDGRTVRMWHHELVKGGVVLIDKQNAGMDDLLVKLKVQKIEVIDLPLKALAGKHQIPGIMFNTIMLGAIVGLICYDLKPLNRALSDVFLRKGKEIVDANVRAAKIGYDYVQKHFDSYLSCRPLQKKTNKMLMDGSEGLILGALRGGMTSYSGYPMTPSSPLLHSSAALKKKYNVFGYQTEDEISAAQFAIGAWYAGARAVTGTSGGGFCLMTESLGLAAMTETPMVVMLGMRPGPSTGLPTRTGQGDLRFAMHAGQDEPPRIVLAPGDPQEGFELMFHALNIAEKYQLLVIVLADKYLLESLWTLDPIDYKKYKIDRGKIVSKLAAKQQKKYERYKITSDGVSPWVLPGTSGLQNIWRTSSDEHDVNGYIVDDEKTRIAMMDKRRKKVDTAYKGYVKKIKPIVTHGASSAKKAIIYFGSNRGVVRDALNQNDKKDIKAIQVRCLMPFPAVEVEAALKNVRQLSVIEGNDSGVFAGLIREHTGRLADKNLRYYDGRPLTIRRVLEFINK